jgi:hypothetical protein
VLDVGGARMDKNRLYAVAGTRQIGMARAADHTDAEVAVDGCLPTRFAAMTRGLLGGPDAVVVVYASLASAFGVVTATGSRRRMPSGSACPCRGHRRLPLRSGRSASTSTTARTSGLLDINY